MDARAWLLLDVTSGQAIASRNPQERIEPASQILAIRGKFRIGHGRPRHTEWRDFHSMSPFFVIKHKRLVRRSPQVKSPARDVHIPRQRTTPQGRWRVPQVWGRVG